MRQQLAHTIFNPHTSQEFEKLALEVFRYQYAHNVVYQKFCDLIKQNKPQVFSEIPYLPISLFKTQKIQTQKPYQLKFTSSGTTGENTSQHLVFDISIYERSFQQGFRQFYGDPSEYLILALLPSYLQRTGSSLIYMCQKFIEQSKYTESAFFLDDYQALYRTLLTHANTDTKILLLGISYALLEFGAKYNLPAMHNLTLMETGGTKGMQEAHTKESLHAKLQELYTVPHIHSEYGMTELLSQAYSEADGVFTSSNTMQVHTTQIQDSFSLCEHHKTGIINVTDLSNIDSCSFICTEDIGITLNKQQFKILGRLDHAALRGCNLLTVNQ